MQTLLTFEPVRCFVAVWCVYVLTMLVMIAVEDSQLGKILTRGKKSDVSGH